MMLRVHLSQLRILTRESCMWVFSLLSSAVLIAVFCIEPAFAVTRICIDAGHGGISPACAAYGNPYNYGSTSYCEEKNMNLNITNKGRYSLDSNPRFITTSTRAGDYCVSINQRVQIADNADADGFLSIHHNGILDPGSSDDLL